MAMSEVPPVRRPKTGILVLWHLSVGNPSSPTSLKNHCYRCFEANWLIANPQWPKNKLRSVLRRDPRHLVFAGASFAKLLQTCPSVPTTIFTPHANAYDRRYNRPPDNSLGGFSRRQVYDPTFWCQAH